MVTCYPFPRGKQSCHHVYLFFAFYDVWILVNADCFFWINNVALVASKTLQAEASYKSGCHFKWFYWMYIHSGNSLFFPFLVSHMSTTVNNFITRLTKAFMIIILMQVSWLNRVSIILEARVLPLHSGLCVTSMIGDFWKICQML